MYVRIKVPATSANLGPGFDAAGLAVTLYNTFVFELLEEEKLEIKGCPAQFANENNMTYQAFLQAAGHIGLSFKGLQITTSGDVPYTRGLGSSSTCIVAGIVGAYAFLDRQEERQDILNLATAIEGHPDNVAPAIFGGMTVSVMKENQVTTLNIPVKHDYRYIALIPPFTLSTEKARAVLPDKVSRSDAITNVSHLALMVASIINGYDEGLKLGFKDKLHQPYRGKLIENYFPIMEVLEKDPHIIGAYLSGAGPTIMAIIKADDDKGVVRLKEELGDLIKGWKVEKLELDTRGYTCDFL
ncbi:homoserine kinase [Eggerthia catenaformis]|uniref:homoserine kinase n=1 Tax=Eggerthia catenaformis TaxID=31973 RepID=UPI00047E1464|nr:homoserine kinase [Eggerthia catenaformis]